MDENLARTSWATLLWLAREPSLLWLVYHLQHLSETKIHIESLSPSPSLLTHGTLFQKKYVW